MELGMGIELPTGGSYHHLGAFPAAFLPFLFSSASSWALQVIRDIGFFGSGAKAQLALDGLIWLVYCCL